MSPVVHLDFIGIGMIKEIQESFLNQYGINLSTKQIIESATLKHIPYELPQEKIQFPIKNRISIGTKTIRVSPEIHSIIKELSIYYQFSISLLLNFILVQFQLRFVTNATNFQKTDTQR